MKRERAKVKRGKMKNKLKSTLCLLFVIIFLLSVVFGSLSIIIRSSHADSGYYTSAKAMCVMESSSKRVLASKNEETKLAMASTTKIMTAITAIESGKDLDESFVISPKAVGVSGTSLYLRAGEEFTLRDLLYGLMLISGNDASVVIGEYCGGTVNNFVDMMNKKAKEIGAENSHFDNTHGLDSKTHYTTAYDLALITSYAMQNETFKDIVSTKNTKITNADGKSRYLKNKNKLLSSLDGCNGVKTGFTDDAGRCLVTSCERDGMNVVCVVLNCGPMFEESATLIDRAFKEYHLIDLTSGYAFKNRIVVDSGQQEYVQIGTYGKYFYPLKNGELKKVSYIYDIQERIEAPVEKGRIVGEVKIFIDKDLHFTEKIYTMENVRRNSIWEKLKDLVEKW